jgi:hypothetical protein
VEDAREKNYWISQHACRSFVKSISRRQYHVVGVFQHAEVFRCILSYTLLTSGQLEHLGHCVLLALRCHRFLCTSLRPYKK